MPKIDELVYRDAGCFHLEMINDSEAAVNVDDALFYLTAKRGKLLITIIDKGNLEVRE